MGVDLQRCVVMLEALCTAFCTGSSSLWPIWLCVRVDRRTSSRRVASPAHRAAPLGRPSGAGQRRPQPAQRDRCGAPRRGRVGWLVTSETLLRWHCGLVRRHWTQRLRLPGRPPTSTDLHQLILTMAGANPTWATGESTANSSVSATRRPFHDLADPQDRLRRPCAAALSSDVVAVSAFPSRGRM